jgi:hypothetical protein
MGRYPKSEDNATLINFFANALSDDENVRKRELRQVVDAFEYYVR